MNEVKQGTQLEESLVVDKMSCLVSKELMLGRTFCILPFPEKNQQLITIYSLLAREAVGNCEFAVRQNHF